MKAYILKEADFERLRLRLKELDREKLQSPTNQFGEPAFGYRAFNYVVEVWISEVTKP